MRRLGYALMLCVGVAGAPGDDGPLLVIAGAGSGKTNTLAHRVAHLILNGADPQRMLLLTFSRRAALEMERRVGSVLQRVMNLRSSQQAPSLPWAGTFHAIGARLLRDCAQRIGLFNQPWGNSGALCHGRWSPRMPCALSRWRDWQPTGAALVAGVTPPDGRGSPCRWGW